MATGRFRLWWADTPKQVRWTVYTAVPTGLGALVMGLVGDAHGWWKDREFLTNLMSSFTGLLLGVPFALVVLSHLGAKQAEAAVRRNAIRRGREAASRFQETCLKGFTRSVASHALDDLGELRRANAILRTQLDMFAKLMQPSLIQRRHVETDIAETAARAVVQAFEERAAVIDQIFVAANSKQRNAWFAEVAQEWNRLDRDVRPRLEEVGGTWVTSENYETLRRAGHRLDNLATPALMPHRRTLQVLAPPEEGVPGPSDANFRQAADKIKTDTDATLEVVRALLAFLRTLPAVEQVARS